MDYLIVKFPNEDDAVAVIPSKWVLGGECFWPPPPSDVTKLVKRGTSPDFDKWTKCAVTTIKKFGKISQ